MLYNTTSKTPSQTILAIGCHVVGECPASEYLYFWESCRTNLYSSLSASKLTLARKLALLVVEELQGACKTRTLFLSTKTCVPCSKAPFCDHHISRANISSANTSTRDTALLYGWTGALHHQATGVPGLNTAWDHMTIQQISRVGSPPATTNQKTMEKPSRTRTVYHRLSLSKP